MLLQRSGDSTSILSGHKRARQVVWCQQVNLLLSITILRGFGAISAIRQHIITKRSVRWMASPWRSDDRSASALISRSQPTQSQDLTPRDAPETIRIKEDASDDGASIVLSTFPDNASTAVQDTCGKREECKQITHTNRGTTNQGFPTLCSELTFIATQSRTKATRVTTRLMRMRRYWLKSGAKLFEAQARCTTVENDKADALTNINIFGTQRKCEHGVVKWWYLTKPYKITIFSGYKEEPEKVHMDTWQVGLR